MSLSGTPFSSRLRALNVPRPVGVVPGAEGRPAWVGPNSHSPAPPPGPGWMEVEEVLEEWRIDDEWWRDPISRRYLCVLLRGGRRITLFQDLLTRNWYLQEG